MRTLKLEYAPIKTGLSNWQQIKLELYRNKNFMLSFSGAKYQELQIAAMAMFAKLQQYATSTINWYTFTKQPDGVMVPDALSDAPCVPESQRFQGMVC